MPGAVRISLEDARVLAYGLTLAVNDPDPDDSPSDVEAARAVLTRLKTAIAVAEAVHA